MPSNCTLSNAALVAGVLERFQQYEEIAEQHRVTNQNNSLCISNLKEELNRERQRSNALKETFQDATEQFLAKLLEGGFWEDRVFKEPKLADFNQKHSNVPIRDDTGSAPIEDMDSRTPGPSTPQRRLLTPPSTTEQKRKRAPSVSVVSETDNSDNEFDPFSTSPSPSKRRRTSSPESDGGSRSSLSGESSTSGTIVGAQRGSSPSLASSNSQRSFAVAASSASSDVPMDAPAPGPSTETQRPRRSVTRSLPRRAENWSMDTIHTDPGQRACEDE